MAHRMDGMGTAGYHTLPGEQPITVARPSGVHWSGVVRVADHPRAAALPRRRPWDARKARVFVTSMGDLYHDAVTDAFLDELFEIMAARASICDFLTLTKRAARMRRYADDRAARGLVWPSNVWAGVTAENQAFADERIPDLLRVPAQRRFVSAEPLLGPINFRRIVYDGVVVIDALNGTCGWPVPHSDHGRGVIDWVIVGGESGGRARPTHPDWVRQIREDCRSTASFSFKQWGTWMPDGEGWRTTGRWQVWDPAEGRWDEVKGVRPTPSRYDGPDSTPERPRWASVVMGLNRRDDKRLDGRRHISVPLGVPVPR